MLFQKPLENSDFDIIIVGAGPVGMLLACLLVQENIRVGIFDKRIERSNMPRAIAINQATLEIFRTVGLFDKLQQQGLKVDHIDLYWRHKLINQIDFNGLNIPYPYFFHLEQITLELLLESRLEELGVGIIRGKSISELAQSDKQVTACFTDVSGLQEKFHAKYVIGCDGGQSTVRQLLDFNTQEEQYGAYFILADVLLDKGLSYKNTQYILSPDGYVMIVPLPQERYRIILSIKGQYPQKELLELNKTLFQSYLDKRLTGSVQIKKLIWATSSSYGHRLSSEVYKDKVILAGDALHQFSPVGGTNMNVGIQDAMSLAWRLMHSLANHVNEKDLIKEYAQERADVIKEQQKATSVATAYLTRVNHSDNSLKLGDDIRRDLTGFYSSNTNEMQHMVWTPVYQLLRNWDEIKGSNSFLELAKGYYLLIRLNHSKSTEENENFQAPANYLKCVDINFDNGRVENMDFKKDFYYLVRPDGVVIKQGEYFSNADAVQSVSLNDGYKLI